MTYDSRPTVRSIDLKDTLAGVPPGSFPPHLVQGPGLSFAHSDLTNDETMSRLVVESDLRVGGDDTTVVRRVRLRDEKLGLVVDLVYTWYPRHNALVYGMTLANTGSKPIPRLTNLLSSDITFAPFDSIGSPIVHTSGGGLTHYQYPPQAFRLQRTELLGPTELSIDSGPSGRSSNKDFPFFYVEDERESSGVFGGIEWSGMWRYRFRRRDEPDQVHYGHLGPDRRFDILGGIEQVDLSLNPGETFAAPRALLGFYRGSIDDGRNCLRRFIADWIPSLADGTPMPLIQGTPGGYLCPPDLTTAEQCLAHARANAELGVEYYVIECWFKDAPGGRRSGGATGSCRGTWRPELTRFPDLKKLADDVRATGMRFGLWTDMEVVHGASEVAQEHPQWILYLPTPSEHSHPTAISSSVGLLNLGIVAAQDWAIATYDRLVADYGIEWIFYDNNVNPAPYWDANELPHRRGRLQHDYIRGVWRVWDEVRRRHPNVVLENCSSGGRRIDLGTLGRAHCHFGSDQFRHPESIRYQTTGVNTFLPADRVMSFICLGLDDYPATVVQSFFGGFICITEGVEDWSPSLKAKVRGHFDVYKTIRHLLGKDFYPLFPQPQTSRQWEGWQFHDAATDEGFVVVFRGSAPDEDACVQPRCIDHGKVYVVVDPYTSESQTIEGHSLADSGLRIGLPPGGSRLLRYHLRRAG